MKIAKFEHTGLDKAESWILRNHVLNIDEESLKEVLKTINITFVAEGINRLQSTLLCELKDSYVQQSQRYVTMREDAYKLPPLQGHDEEKAIELTKKAMHLYERMSELKEGEFKGRPKLENYKFGIPIEDARYILPLSIKTNLTIAMTGDKLWEMFCLINDKKYMVIFDDFRSELFRYLPKALIALLPQSYDSDTNKELVEDMYKEDMHRVDNENNMVLLSAFKNLDLNVGLGALTSTLAKMPSETLYSWGDEAVSKAKNVAKRVIGYGHTSVSEIARVSVGMSLSLTALHQQIRHRLSKNHREDLYNLITDIERPIIVPQTIKDSIFYKEYMDTVQEFKDFRLHLMKNYGNGEELYFLLNCDQIKLIMSTNARMDCEMLAERICFNAQWEIRELATKKLMILRELSDVLYENALPPCVYGKCPEGALTCGRQQEMKEQFLKK